MAIYLVQHGLSSAKDIDPERGLTIQGKEQTLLIAKVAAGYDVNVEKIVHSGKNRAQQTAEIFGSILGESIPIGPVAGIEPIDNVEAFSTTINLKANTMVVGHLPFMERLVSHLVTGSQSVKIIQFQNSGIVCLDTDRGEGDSLNWYIKWTLNPTIS